MVMATSGGMVADDGRRCASTSSYPKTQPRTVSDRVVLTLVSSDELQRNVEEWTVYRISDESLTDAAGGPG